MKKPEKDLGYYGTAVLVISMGLILFYGVAEGARNKFGDVGIFSVVFITAFTIVLWNKDNI